MKTGIFDEYLGDLTPDDAEALLRHLGNTNASSRASVTVALPAIAKGLTVTATFEMNILETPAEREAASQALNARMTSAEFLGVLDLQPRGKRLVRLVLEPIENDS
jgi:hypothetical protein